MTSMLLTASSGAGVAFRLTTVLLLLRAVPLGVAELLAFLHRRRLQLGPHDLAHGLDPVGDDVPLLAIPLLDHDRPIALVVLARHLDGSREALHAELLEPLLRDVEVLEAPPHLLAGRRLRLELR